MKFNINYNSMETDAEGDLGYGWYHNYESKIAEQSGLLKVWLNPYDSLLFVNEDVMNNKVEGTYQNGAIWLGDTEPENISGESSVSGNTVSGMSMTKTTT